MHKISKADTDRLVALGHKIGSLFGDYEDVVDRFKVELDIVTSKIEEAQAEAAGVVEDLASTAQAYADDRSEKWTESDAGIDYLQWISNLEEFQRKIEVEVEFPEITPRHELEPGWVEELANGELPEKDD